MATLSNVTSNVTYPPATVERPGAISLPLSIGIIVMIAFAVHAPLLMMELPVQSVDATTHMFFAQHYAQNWFQPWNEKWFGGFSQTSFPPLAHQWTALFAKFMSVKLAYMLVQMIALLLLVSGVYRYARVWLLGSERASEYAALGTIFLGSLALLIYQAGQLPTILATALLLHALAHLYWWARRPDVFTLVSGVLLAVLAATADHITILFGSLLFGAPMVFRILFAKDDASVFGATSRTVIFLALAGAGIGIALAPFWSFLLNNPSELLASSHGSRDNFLQNLTSAMSYWIIPLGAVLLVLPFIFVRGVSSARMLPLFLAFYVALILGLGATTPVARIALGHFFDALTLDRFTFWATLLAMPFVGMIAARAIDRAGERAIAALAIAAILSFGISFAWMSFHPVSNVDFKTDPVVNFLGRDNHDRYRYLTLGFGPQFADVTMRASAKTVDGAFPLGRLLPEMRPYGWARLDQAKTYGSAGMEALRAVLKHANNYGLKYIFVRDRYYEPLLAFAGWRQVESYDNGNVTLWSKEDVPTARPMEQTEASIPNWQRLAWGILPMAMSVVVILISLFRRDPVAVNQGGSREPHPEAV